MSIIYSYPEQSILNPGDMLIGTSVEKVGGKQKNVTKNFTIQQVADFINGGIGLIDPVASDFQIPVFNQGGLKITGSIMSQDAFPNGTGITIAGNLTVNGGATIGDQVSNVVFDSPTKLLGPILDSGSVQGGVNQILISNQLGKVNWIDYEAGLTYEGTWDAAANTTNGQSNSPALVQGVGVSGHFYIVDVEGTTSLGPGLNDWHVGDWAVFLDQGGQPASWQKIDNTSVLTGDGTAGVFAKWTDTTTLNDSLMSQSGTNILINGGLKVKDTVEATTTNSNLKLKGNGTGGIEIMSADGTTDGKITLNCSQNSHGVTLQSPAHGSGATYTLILPTSFGGAGDVLTSAGANPSQLVWTTPTTGTVTGTGTENYVTKWSTGGTGIEDSTIFDNGTNVGIGTTSPNVRTEIAASVNGNPATVGSVQTNGALRVRGSATNVLDIGQQSAAPYAMWMQVGESTNLGVNYPLVINPNGGNVGIGTSTPSFSSGSGLQITNDTQANLRFTDTTNSTFITDLALANDNFYIINRTASGQLKFRVNSSIEAMTIASSGNVGIGVTSSINGTLTLPNSGVISFHDANGAARNSLQFVSGELKHGAAGAGLTTQTFFTNGSEKMRIDSTGNVGIGTDNPGAPFVISDSNTDGLEFDNSISSSSRIISYRRSNDTFRPLRLEALRHVFSISGNEKMRIDSDGNVGIGTSSPSVSLDISATDAVQMPVGVTNDRPTTGVASNGMLRYNSTNNGFEGYINGNWGDIGGGTSGGLIFRGTFNASTGAIASGGSLYTCPAGGSGGTVDTAIGDLYIVTTAGSFFCSGTSLNVGDEVICTTAALAGFDNVNNWNAVATAPIGAFLPLAGGTMTGVTQFNDHTNYGDQVHARFGVSQDLQIYHDGSDSYINDTGTGDLRIDTNKLRLRIAGGTETMMTATENGSVDLYYDDSKKLETTSAGISVTGNGLFTADGINAVDLNRLTSDGAIANFRKDGTLIGYIGSNTTSGQPLLDIAGATGNSNIRFLTTNTERIRITNTGNVGIGTDNPTNYTNFTTLAIGNSSQGGVLEFQYSGSQAARIAATSANTLQFVTNDVEAIRITSAGQVRFNNYTSATSFTGTAVASLAVDSGGNIITEAAGGGGAGTITTNNFSGNGTVGPFTLGATPSGGSTSFVDVFIDGVYQEITTYSVTGTALTFVTAVPSGVTIETKTTSGNVSGALVSSVDIGQSSGNTGAVNLRIAPVEVTSGQTRSGNANSLYIFTATAGGSIATVTLPGSPTLGDSIKISNLGGLANVLGANGNKIMGVAQDMTINTPTAAFEIIWSGSNNGWIIIGNV